MYNKNVTTDLISLEVVINRKKYMDTKKKRLKVKVITINEVLGKEDTLCPEIQLG